MTDEEHALEAQDNFPEDWPVPNASGDDNGMRNRGSKKPGDSRLSEVSQKYDLEGKGKLDEVQQAMRDMDSQRFGYLSNDKVYKILQEQIKTQNELLSMKRITIALGVFTLILALSNLGTAFAAARLAKDTSVDSAGNLVDKNHADIPVGVRESAVVIGLEQDATLGRRNLQTTENVTVSQSVSTLDFTYVETLVEACNGGSVIFTLHCVDGGVTETIPIYGCSTGLNLPVTSTTQGWTTWNWARDIVLGSCKKKPDPACPLRIPAKLVENDDACRLNHPAVYFPGCSTKPTSKDFVCSDSCKVCGCEADSSTCGSTGSCVAVDTATACQAAVPSAAPPTDAPSDSPSVAELTCDGVTEPHYCRVVLPDGSYDGSSCTACPCRYDTSPCDPGERCVFRNESDPNVMSGCVVFD